MRLDRLFESGRCVFALEVFPPKSDMGVESVYNTLDRLAEVPADYVSVTYSAGGTGNKAYTAEIARYLKYELGVEPLPHLTCYGSSRDEIARELDALRAAGAENVLALRGDRAPGVTPHNDFIHASDLMAEVRASGDFYIAGACYPEGHPESDSLAADIESLKYKTDAGAGHLVSQLFFDNGKFFRFLNMLRKRGVNCPVEAGVMPIVKPDQVKRTLKLSSASLPAEFSKLMTRYGDDEATFFEAGIDYAVRQIRDLIDGGADGIHLYAMNRPTVARRIYERIADLLEETCNSQKNSK